MAQLIYQTLNPIYSEIGVNPIINAGGLITAYGGSRMSLDVLEAMHEASKSFVDIVELNKKIGEYIAQMTKAEAGMVTNGAASGMILSAAACMTGTDASKIRRLPDTSGMKNELVIQKIHRGAYSHIYNFSGAKFVEVGNINECLPEELKEAITEKTAAVAFLCCPFIPSCGLDLNEVVEIAHARGVPVIIDAGPMLPPKENLSKYIEQGADLVTFSGGKIIGGPQASGLLFGRKILIEAAFANASPNRTLGRPHKVSKESMTGLYVALKNYIKSDEESMIRNFRQRLLPIMESLVDIQGIHVDIRHDQVNYLVPTLTIQCNAGWQGLKGLDLMKMLLHTEPRIFTRVIKGFEHLMINPINLQEGEVEIVSKRIRELLHLSNA